MAAAALLVSSFFHTRANLSPSGIETWRDSQGEYLHGCWRDGLPQAPYLSRREFQARGAFKAVLIGVTSSCAEPADVTARKPRFLEENAYAVTSVECCVSERFYHGFPLVTFVLGQPGEEGSVEHRIEADDMLSSCNVGNAHPLRGTEKSPEARPEALIFVPGFNCSLNGSVCTFAQYLTLGGYPSEVVPVCFY